MPSSQDSLPGGVEDEPEASDLNGASEGGSGGEPASEPGSEEWPLDANWDIEDDVDEEEFLDDVETDDELYEPDAEDYAGLYEYPEDYPELEDDDFGGFFPGEVLEIFDSDGLIVESEEREVHETRHWMSERLDEAVTRERAAATVKLMDDMAASTAGNYVGPCAGLAYRMPTDTCHGQTADSIAAAQCSEDGSVLVAAVSELGVSLYRLPSAGAESSAGHDPNPIRLGGFQKLPSGVPYSMAMTSDARLLFTGGEHGLLAVYALDPSAPPMPKPPQRQDAVIDHERGPTFFYTPFMPPDLARLAGSDSSSVWRPERCRAHIDYLKGRSQQHMGAFMCPTVDGERQYVDNTDLLPTFYEPDMLIENTDYCDALGRNMLEVMQSVREAAATADPCASKFGSITMAGAVGLGFANTEQAEKKGTFQDGMVNGVRCGLVGGKERLLAAEQSGVVYVFELPQIGIGLEGVLEAMPCEGLEAPASSWTMRPVSSP